MAAPSRRGASVEHREVVAGGVPSILGKYPFPAAAAEGWSLVGRPASSTRGSAVSAASVAESGSHVAVGFYDGTVELWDVRGLAALCGALKPGRVTRRADRFADVRCYGPGAAAGGGGGGGGAAFYDPTDYGASDDGDGDGDATAAAALAWAPSSRSGAGLPTRSRDAARLGTFPDEPSGTLSPVVGAPRGAFTSAGPDETAGSESGSDERRRVSETSPRAPLTGGRFPCRSRFLAVFYTRAREDDGVSDGGGGDSYESYDSFDDDCGGVAAAWAVGDGCAGSRSPAVARDPRLARKSEGGGERASPDRKHPRSGDRPSSGRRARRLGPSRARPRRSVGFRPPQARRFDEIDECAALAASDAADTLAFVGGSPRGGGPRGNGARGNGTRGARSPRPRRGPAGGGRLSGARRRATLFGRLGRSPCSTPPAGRAARAQAAARSTRSTRSRRRPACGASTMTARRRRQDESKRTGPAGAGRARSRAPGPPPSRRSPPARVAGAGRRGPVGRRPRDGPPPTVAGEDDDATWALASAAPRRDRDQPVKVRGARPGSAGAPVPGGEGGCSARAVAAGPPSRGRGPGGEVGEPRRRAGSPPAAHSSLSRRTGRATSSRGRRRAGRASRGRLGRRRSIRSRTATRGPSPGSRRPAAASSSAAAIAGADIAGVRSRAGEPPPLAALTNERLAGIREYAGAAPFTGAGAGDRLEICDVDGEGALRVVATLGRDLAVERRAAAERRALCRGPATAKPPRVSSRLGSPRVASEPPLPGRPARRPRGFGTRLPRQASTRSRSRTSVAAR